MSRWAYVLGSSFVFVTVATGCTIKDDASRFREAVPQQDQVALAVPGSSTSSSGTTTASHTTQGLHVTAEQGAATAKYYQFTRDIADGVDAGTALTLGGLWAVINTTPTTTADKKFIWGPGGGGLDPVIWRLTGTEVGDDEYDYVLEGQPKSGGDFRTVLEGHGYGQTRAEHKSGWFQWNNDTYAALDPARGKDHGTAKITYDLRKVPATIAVELRLSAADKSKGWLDVAVSHDAGSAGSVDLKGLVDISDAKDTKLEDVHILSRWTANGAGRADLLMQNGDLPFPVDASECWSDAFARTYYKDKVDFEPASGDPSTCAFPASAL